MSTHAARFEVILHECIFGVLLFPVWWYTTGLVRMWNWCLMGVNDAWRGWGVLVWAQALFVPMYGEQSWQGRLISFFVRLAVLLYRLVGLVGTVALYLLMVAFYFILIPFAFALFWYGKFHPISLR